MQAYRIETTLLQDGELVLRELPWEAGSEVEVIILRREQGNGQATNGTQLQENVDSLRRQQTLAEIQNGLFSRLLKPGDPPPSEEFSRRKTEEKRLEERHWTA